MGCGSQAQGLLLSVGYGLVMAIELVGGKAKAKGRWDSQAKQDGWGISVGT